MMRIAEVVRWPDRYLFLFSHMRSYSSVLSHVLGAHPEIAGYSESHLKYRHGSDLAALRWRIARAIGGVPTGRYLLDKLLHNYMLIPRQLRHSDSMRSLIFVRRPVPTLQSILRMHSMLPQVGWHGDPAAVAVYYCERLTWVAAVGVMLKERALAFPAEAITGQTHDLLGAVGDHLGLSSSLAPVYTPKRYTGQAAYGDISPNIQRGHILQGAELHPEDDESCPGFSPELIRQCERSYRRSVALLADWCPSFGLDSASPSAIATLRITATGSDR